MGTRLRHGLRRRRKAKGTFATGTVGPLGDAGSKTASSLLFTFIKYPRKIQDGGSYQEAPRIRKRN